MPATKTVTYKDVKCNNCNVMFDRTSRSRVCSICREILKKKKKSIRNKKYYIISKARKGKKQV
jgi:hypothetical protein